MLCARDPWSSPLSPAGVVDRHEIIYPISLAVAWRFGASPGTVQHFRGRRGRVRIVVCFVCSPQHGGGTMPATIGRRELIAAFGCAAAWPLAAGAQQGERMRRVGVLVAAAAGDPEYQARNVAFLQSLQQLGWAEGRNVRIDTRWATTNSDDVRRHAAELAAPA